MISAVVLNYNDYLLTEKYVRRLEQIKEIDHIVVVDNCSHDDSYEQLKALVNDRIDVIRTGSNVGYAGGNNYGITYIVKKFGESGRVLISNPDIEIEDDAIGELSREFERDNTLFAVTGLLHNRYGKVIPSFIWKLPTIPMLFINCSIVLRGVAFKVFSYGTRYDFSGQERLKKELLYGDAIPGCFFMADLKKMRELGLFCPRTFLFFE